MSKTKLITFVVAFMIGTMSVSAIRSALSRKEAQEVDVPAIESQNSDESRFVADLTAEDLEEREQAAEAIRNERKKPIDWSIQYPTSSHPWHDPKHLAILLLGDLRAVEAVPVLLENLKYKNPKTIVVREPLDIGGRRPAA